MERSETDHILARVGPEAIMRVLTPYVSESRRRRIDVALAGRMVGVHVAVEEPYDPHNAAAVVRSTEALGAGGVHVINAHARVLQSRRTTQGAFHWVERQQHRDVSAFAGCIRARGMRLYGAAMDGELTLSAVPTDEPLCLLFGNEHRGLSVAARETCDAMFRIPMYGFSESLNLSVSAAVSLYDVLMRRRAAMGRESDLIGPEWIAERARCYLQSVDPRFAAGLPAMLARKTERGRAAEPQPP